MDIPSNTILFLKGVFLNDCPDLEQSYFERYNTNTNNLPKINKKITYSKIPKTFNDIKEWANLTKDSNIKCWYCESLFSGIPVFIPNDIYQTAKGQTLDVYGVFCTFGCAYAFLNSQTSFIENRSYWNKREYLKILFSKFYNKKIDDFTPSINKYSLEAYGGDMNINDYKDELKKINNLNIH